MANFILNILRVNHDRMIMRKMDPSCKFTWWLSDKHHVFNKPYNAIFPGRVNIFSILDLMRMRKKESDGKGKKEKKRKKYISRKKLTQRMCLVNAF